MVPMRHRLSHTNVPSTDAFNTVSDLSCLATFKRLVKTELHNRAYLRRFVTTCTYDSSLCERLNMRHQPRNNNNNNNNAWEQLAAEGWQLTPTDLRRVKTKPIITFTDVIPSTHQPLITQIGRTISTAQQYIPICSVLMTNFPITYCLSYTVSRDQLIFTDGCGIYLETKSYQEKLASCLHYEWKLEYWCIEYFIFILWVHSFSTRLTSVTFAADKVIIFLILRKNAKIVQLWVKPSS